MGFYFLSGFATDGTGIAIPCGRAKAVACRMVAEQLQVG
jgi:hypothetical protein